MPSASATAHACCPPAPPNVVSTYSVTSRPRCTEIFLIALAMFATATRRKPDATSSAVVAVPVLAVTSAARRANRSRTTSASRDSSPLGPNTAGKYSGWTRPSSTFASVTVSGPPRR